VKKWIAVSGGLLLTLLFFGVSIASPIVDGDPSDWSPVMKIYHETSEAHPIPEVADIVDVYFTSDNDYLYWRFDTVLTTDWDQIGLVAICMDTDNRSANDAACGPCSSDYVIKIDPSAQQVAELWTNATCEPVPNADVQAFSLDMVTEVAVKRADVGLGSPACYPFCDIPSSVFLESADAAERDESGILIARTSQILFLPLMGKQ